MTGNSTTVSPDCKDQLTKPTVCESLETDELENSISDEEKEYQMSSQYAGMVTVDMICEDIVM